MKTTKFTSASVERWTSFILRSVCLCAFMSLCLLQPVQAATTDQISQYGITWIFDKEYEYGQFANGDYWVVGPMTIISINPPSTYINGRVRNGSMVNPVSTGSQGYDTEYIKWTGANFYDTALNAARPNGNDLTIENPLILQPDSSLVSAISLNAPGYGDTILKTAAVLTILSSPAPEGSFRPPYSGNDKTIRFNKSQLNYSLLKKLAPPVNIDLSTLTRVERHFERPWLDNIQRWMGRALHPIDNMPDYGREMAIRIGDGALMLHLNFTDKQKEKLLIRYVQLGIDFFGIVKNGGISNWVNDGGHTSGRKWPILFAGLILNDSEMKNIGQKSGDYLYSGSYGPYNCPPDYIHFGEDDQTFYVTQMDIDRTHSPLWVSTWERQTDVPPDKKNPYEISNLGLPEWGILHATYPWQCNAWWGTPYRASCTGASWVGFILAAHIMGVKELWNHNALFDYMDRYVAIDEDWRNWQQLAAPMWDTYREDHGPVYIGLDTETHERIYSSPDEILYGDIDGDGRILAYDAALVAMHIVGVCTLSGDALLSANVDGDVDGGGNSKITVYDAALIARRAVRLIDHFPVEK